MEQRDEVVAAAAEIVSAYVAKNSISPADLPRLIQEAVDALATKAPPGPDAPLEPQKPAVPIKKSVAPDHIVCLEDGKHFTSLKRHLRTDHNLSPVAYRAKWGLPKDHPMVAPSFSERRSALAREHRFGERGRAVRLRPSPTALSGIPLLRNRS